MFRIEFFTEETLTPLEPSLSLVIVFWIRGSEWKGKMWDHPKNSYAKKFSLLIYRYYPATAPILLLDIVKILTSKIMAKISK